MIEFDKMSDFFSGFYGFKPRDEFIYLDFHLRTTVLERFTTLPFVLDLLKGKKHLIAITDHNDIRGAIAACDLGINNVPAIEVGCSDGFDLLVFFKELADLETFYRQEVESNKHLYRMTRTTKDIFYYLDVLADRPCYLSIPHINGFAQNNYLKNKPDIKMVLNRVDAIETYNHALPKNRNINAQIIRRVYQRDATFGSDVHINHELQSFYRLLESEEKRYRKLMGNLYEQQIPKSISA
ncbi:PHP domain-containing protein [Photobacterium alginatilyticum]|uniref:PHP domain-containing protein n=1 Tax=Photobacterium alginatilyticum TaxID=1775171 RepID=A0ABW9YMJ4_9GAMM|nr:PHP domain-containing protein [Photobacterium alginatilyticum]NBI55087.1 PHP domain-containing protein [Photobacterium alginatilyticum]